MAGRSGLERWRHRRRLELAAVFVILGLFVALVLMRLPHYEAAAEEANLEANVAALRAGLMQAVAVAEIHGDAKTLAAFAGTNPVAFTAAPPGGYLGVRAGLEPARARPGTWYFDPRTGVLVYRVRAGWAFASPLESPARVEFKVVLARDGVPRLVSLAPYSFHP